jgi:hypothetical protein
MTPAGSGKSRLLRRLPVLLVLGLGLLLWRAPFFPQERVWVVELSPEWRAATRLDVQLYDGSEALLRREERAFTHGAPERLSFDLTLPQGTYRARVFGDFPPGSPQKRWSAELRVGGDDRLVSWVR